MQLPNPNKDGTASVGMMQLSLQETSTNYLQGIYEEIGSLKNILISMRGFDKQQVATKKEELADKKVSDANQKARDAENKRESLLGRAGGGLKQAATTVKDKSRDIASGFSTSGFLSTLVGGAILMAIFAPEKSKEMMTALQGGFESLMDSKFFDKVKQAAKGIFDEFGWDNLIVTGILGWRIGAIYSGVDWVGAKVKEWVGIPEVDANAMDEQTGEGGTVTLTDEILDHLNKNFTKYFAGAGVAAILMPGAVFGLIKAMIGAVSG